MALNSTAACVLGLLDIGPPPPDRDRWSTDGTMSGAELWTAIERSVGGFWSMTRSQVYQEIKRVTGAKLVDEPTTGRYRITDSGRIAVRSWFHDFALSEPRDDQVRSAVALTVFFGHFLPAQLVERVVREHRLRLERRLDQLRRIERSLREDRSLPGSTLVRGVMNTECAIGWTGDVLARLEEAATSTPRARRSTRSSPQPH
jgi:DNA-binding PadR family transcriptional regulator